MSGSVPAHWLDRVSESLREHEDRRSSIQSAPPRYEILGEISRGGMGIVYRAWDPQLGRNVALKVLNPGDGRAAEAHERFEREAKLAAGLHHPHIVQVFDTGTWEGQDYIAMQLIEGTTLDQAKPDRRQALMGIRDAARALHYAHEQGIIHRDVKPGNLLVDGSGRVYVTDFGVARQAVVSATITSPGTVVGTPVYMSPEQAQGMPTDARSDVYSLGAALYELVTGRAPVQGRDAMEVLERVRLRDPEPPTKVAPDLSKNIEAILLAAMERVPGDRYATAAELADDIDRYLTGERPLRRARGASYRVRREFVRHPWRSTAAIVLCALLLGAGIFVGYVIRGYRALEHGLNSNDREERKRDFTVAGVFFERARAELAAIQAREVSEARDLADRQNAEKERIKELQRQQDQARKDEQRQTELALANRAVDEKDRQRKAAVRYADFLAAVTDGALTEARKVLEELKELDSEKHLAALPKLSAKEFTLGVAELDQLSPSDRGTVFDARFAELSGPKYQGLKDHDSLLAGPAWQRGLALERLGRLKEAVAWFDQAESLGKKDADLNEHRGICLLGLREWKRAEDDRNQLLVRRPDQPLPAPFAELPYRKGGQYLIEKNWDAANLQLVIATTLNPRHAMAFHDRGIARFRSLGLTREVFEEDLGRALSIDPALKPGKDYRDIALAFSRGEAEKHWKDEKAEDRSAAWTRVLAGLATVVDQVAPDDPALLLERSAMRRRLGDLSQALTDARRADEIRSSIDSRLAVAILSALQAKDESQNREAIELFNRAGQLSPGEARVSYWRGLCRRRLGKSSWETAYADFDSAHRSSPGLPHLALVLARTKQDLLGNSRDKEEWAAVAGYADRTLAAVESLGEEEFLAASLDYPGLSRARMIVKLTGEAHLTRAQALYEREDFEASIEACSAAIALDAGDASRHLWRGYARCKARHHKEAQQDLTQALKLFTEPADIQNAQGWLKFCQKHARD